MKSRVVVAGMLGLVLLSLGLLTLQNRTRSTLAQPPSAPSRSEVVLYVDEALGQDGEALITSYSPPAGTTVRLLRGPGGEAAQAVAAGRADLALTLSGAGGDGVTAAPAFYQAQVLAAPWLDPVQNLPLDEARRVASAADPSAPPAAGPRLLPAGSAGFTPDLQPVTVDGVLPSLANIRTGRYPLSQAVYLVSRQGTQPGLVSTLAGWLSRPEAGDSLNKAVPQATLAVVGDIMLGRGVDGQIAKHGTGWPFELVSERLRAADLTFANLEAPLGVTGTPLPRKLIWLRGRPESAPALAESGVDAVTLANNHILDFDTPSFLETLDLLDKQGIRHVGGGRTLAEARAPVILEANGVRIAFLGYSGFADLFFDYKYPRRFTATDPTPGHEAIPGVAPIDVDLIRRDIAQAREQADVVAVAYHWGTEYVNVPAPEMVALAHASVDAGADLVLGYHPHAVQGFEWYKGRFIAYSLGNFIMDQRREITRESMLLEILVQKDGVRAVHVTPVMIDEFRPHLSEGSEAESLWSKLRRISGQIPKPAGMHGASGPFMPPPPSPAPTPTAPAPATPQPSEPAPNDGVEQLPPATP